jgi:hypothetical protein
MTVRQTTRSLLRRAQAESSHALAGIATKYGLKVTATPEATHSAYETAMKVVVAMPTYRSPAIKSDRKIVFIARRNPHLPGSKSAATFEALRRSSTVAEFRARAVKSAGKVYPWYVNWAAKPRGDKPALIKLR